MVANPDDDKRYDVLQKSDMNNQKLEAYYRKQLEMDDDEWCTFLATCREQLPSTFRISGSRECVCLPFGYPCSLLSHDALYQDGICAYLCGGENLRPTSHWCRLRRSTYSPAPGPSMVSTSSG